MSTPNPATTDWVPLYPAGAQPIPPVENEKWLKGESGAMVWRDLPAASTPARLGAYAANIETGEGGYANDWNTIAVNGWFMSSTAANAPASGWWIGQVVAHNTDWVTQELWAFTDPVTAIRRYRRQRSGGTWTAWIPVGAGPTVYRDSQYRTTSSSSFTGMSSFTIPAGLLKTGSTVRYTFAGDFQNASASPISLRQRLDFGPVVLHDDTWGYDLANTLSWRPWRIVFELQAWGGTHQVYGVGHTSIGNYNGSPSAGAGKLGAPHAVEGTGGDDYGHSAAIGTASAVAIDLTAQHVFILYAALGRTDGGAQARHLWSMLEIIL